MTALNQTFTLHGRQQWELFVAFIKANVSGKLLGVTVFDADEKKRTDAQNRFYWKARMTYLQDNAWVNGKRFSKEAWHEHLADKFAPREELALPDGTFKTVRKSTTDMKVKEFAKYIEEIEAWCATELGISFE
jgi:hypothetical protein